MSRVPPNGEAVASTKERRGRPRAMSDEERRSRILEAARQAFIEYGFARTSTDVVAKIAKVSKRSIYEGFVDKTALFAEVIRRHEALFLDLPRPIEENLPLIDILVRIFRLDIDEAAAQEREALLNLINRESLLFPELSDHLYATGIIRAREELIDWLTQQNKAGKLRIDDPLVCAGMLMDIVFGALLPRRRLQKNSDIQIRRQHIIKRMEIFLKGVGS